MSPVSVREIAQLIDHALLHPTLTDAEVRAGCELAHTYGVASVCVKPCSVSFVREQLRGSTVRVGTVVGFPHGTSSTAIKAAETLQALRDGAVDIEMVINVGNVLSGDWLSVATEIQTINDICRPAGVILKVIFETDFLPTDELKIRLCAICTIIGVGYVKTSTGFGFVKTASGEYNYQGATDHDIRLMALHVGPAVGVKASGGIRTLDELLNAVRLGDTRIGTSSTAAILTEAYARFGGDAPVLSSSQQTDY